MAMSIVKMQTRLEVLKIVERIDASAGGGATVTEMVTMADMFYKFIIGE